MGIFEKTRMEEAQFKDFISKVDSVYQELLPYEQYIDISEIQSIKNNFIIKTEDFFQADRKFNIGIIGRVKSGKSSFLNTLLFEGQDLLPKAVTPKTAVLTKIEYADSNMLDIEYIPNADRKGMEHKGFDSYEELTEELNDYIGENGAYTDSVKSVVIHMDREELYDISIVDTPGFCDPVITRTEKTKQFLELCDVVFFLSKSTGFLDKGDVELLASQLPLKGVKKLVLLCSRLDDGLRDTIWSKKSLTGAIEDIKVNLGNHAEKTFENYWNKNYGIKGNVMEQCKKPIYISSMAQNMAKKSKEKYTEQEKKTFEDLNQFGDLTTDLLESIGNFKEVKQIFEEILVDKDEILAGKAISFAALGREELKNKLLQMEKFVEKRLQQLRNMDKEEIMERKKILSNQVNGVKADLEQIFGEVYLKINQNKADTSRELMGLSRECSQISDREGIERHYQVSYVSNSRWFMPWTWGASSKEVNSYDEKYTYIDISDAFENFRIFADKAKSDMEDSLRNVIDIAVLKNQLLSTVLKNFDDSDGNYDASYFKMVVEKTLAQIEFPIINLNISSAVENVTQGFSGEIRSIAKMTELKSHLVRVASDLFNEFGRIFGKECDAFKEELEGLKQHFSTQLLCNMSEEMGTLMLQMDEKDREILRYNEILTALRRLDMN